MADPSAKQDHKRVEPILIPDLKLPERPHTLGLVKQEYIDWQVNEDLKKFNALPSHIDAQSRKISLQRELQKIEKAEIVDLVSRSQENPFYKQLYWEILNSALPKIIINQNYDNLNQLDFNYREKATSCYLKLQSIFQNSPDITTEIQKTFISQLHSTKDSKLKTKIINSFSKVGNVCDEAFNELKAIATKGQGRDRLVACQAIAKAVFISDQGGTTVDQNRLKEVFRILEKEIPSKEDVEKDQKKEKSLQRLAQISGELALNLKYFEKLERTDFDSITAKLLPHLKAESLSRESFRSILFYTAAACFSKNNQIQVIESLDQLTDLIKSGKRKNWENPDNDKFFIKPKSLEDEIRDIKQAVRSEIISEELIKRFPKSSSPPLIWKALREA